MNYHPLVKNTRKSKFPVTLLILVIAISIIIIFGAFLQRISYPIVGTIAAPFTGAGVVLSRFGDGILSLFTDKRTLIAENEDLKEELQVKELELLHARLLISENEALRGVLERVGEGEIIFASVVSKPDISPYDTVIIDAGIEDGVSPGDYALYAESAVVGEVAAVYQSTSRVRFFSSPGEERSVLIGESGIEARAVGLGGGNFEVVLPRGVDVVKGDVVTFPEVSDKVFGVVEKVGAGPSDTFQKILFKNPMNIAEIRFLGIQKHE